MRHFYDSNNEISSLQKRWTTYLQIAIRHKRADYLRKLISIIETEVELPGGEDDNTYLPGSNSYTEMTKDHDDPENYILLRHDISGSLLRLPVSSRQIVFCKIFEGKTFRAIAKELCMKEGTVKTLFYKALEEMRSDLT